MIVKQMYFHVELSFILCKFLIISLTGHIPFYGNSYREIVMRNMKGDINFNFSKYKIKVSEDSKSILYLNFPKSK